ncbi:hypothetical protein PANT_15d00009 [Moesziomyces antarcticus T-34]|uniref:Uncharacterized protein n=1 Tax=Pseudozyma antarctica (strain T-34) TaxID=1151754 RepID=M9MGK0_PSEA3|nr:hypothetical protein PANT_15d00009 [Moesziomyces antarcticus T-34]
MVGCKLLEATKKVKNTTPDHKQAGGADHLHLAQELGRWCELYMHTYHWQLTCYNAEKASQAGKSTPAHSSPLDLRTAIHWGRHYAGLVMLKATTKKEVNFQVLLRKLDTLLTGALSPATTAPGTTAPATASPSIWHQEGMSRAATASATPDATARDPTVIVAGFVVGAALRYHSALLTALGGTYTNQVEAIAATQRQHSKETAGLSKAKAAQIRNIGWIPSWPQHIQELYRDCMDELRAHPRYEQARDDDTIWAEYCRREGELAALGMELVRQTMLLEEDSSNEDDDEPTATIISSDSDGDSDGDGDAVPTPPPRPPLPQPTLPSPPPPLHAVQLGSASLLSPHRHPS